MPVIIKIRCHIGDWTGGIFMSNTSIMLLVASIYVVFTIFVGLWSKKFAGTSSKFMTGGRDMGTLVIGVLLMSEFIGTGSTMGTAEAAFGKGISASWNLISMFFAFVLFAYFMAPRFQRLGEYTISGAIAHKYGESARMITSIIMIYALTVVNISMYVGGAATIATILKIPNAVAIYITGAVTILYVVAGGLKGVAYTNLIHATIKYFGMIVTLVVALQMTGGWSGMELTLPAAYFSWDNVGIGTIIAWTVANIGAIFSTQYVIQAITAIPDEGKAKRASLLSGVMIVPIGIMAAIVGMAFKVLYPTAKGMNSIPTFATLMDPWLGGLVVAGLVAAVFGTVSAGTLGSTALVMKDLYIPMVKPNERHLLLATRILAIVIGLLPIPFAMMMPGILKTIFFARALRTAISMVAITMFFLPYFSSGKGAVLGLLLATVSTTAWFLLGNPFGIDNIFVAAIVPLLVMGIDHLVNKNKKQAENVAIGGEI